MPDTDATILIGYDGSDDAELAIRAAGRLLAPRRAVVAYVWDSLAELLLNTDIETLYEPMQEPAAAARRGGRGPGERDRKTRCGARRRGGLSRRTGDRAR